MSVQGRSSWAHLCAAQDKIAAHTHTHFICFSSFCSLDPPHFCSHSNLPRSLRRRKNSKDPPYTRLTHTYTRARRRDAPRHSAVCMMEPMRSSLELWSHRNCARTEEEFIGHQLLALCLSCRSDSCGPVNCIEAAYSGLFVFRNIQGLCVAV